MSADIHAAVKAMTDATARSQGINTLGELRAALKMLPPETPVVMESGDAPAELASYRGYYERLAIGTSRANREYATEVRRFAADRYDPEPNVAEVTIAEPVTAAEMVKALDLANGETFGGYKGGSFVMHAGTFMHHADWGDCGDAVVGLRLEADRVVIETEEEEW